MEETACVNHCMGLFFVNGSRKISVFTSCPKGTRR